MRPTLRFFLLTAYLVIGPTCANSVRSQDSFEDRFTRPWREFAPQASTAPSIQPVQVQHPVRVGFGAGSDDKLLKRKERFGAVTASASSGDLDEKRRKRAERFKTGA